MLRRLLIPDPGTLCALAVAIPAAFSRLISFDVFFNIASGRYILSHGFPTRDPFSLTAAGTWFPHEWGYGILAALSVDSMGGRGPAILTALILGASVLVLWKAIARVGGRAGGRAGLLPLVLLLLALAAQSYTWQAQRGYQLGNLLFVLCVFLVFRFRDRPDRWVWLTLPLILAWANLHGSWLAGPALLGATAAGLAVDRRPARSSLTLAGLAVLGFLAAACSPRGFQTCLYPLGFLAAGKGQSILEWHSMDLSLGLEKMVLVLLLIYLLAFLRAKQRSFAVLIPACGLGLAAVVAERFVPMAAAFLAVACAETLAGQEFARDNPLSSALGRVDRALGAYRLSASGTVWFWLLLLGAGALAAAGPVKLDQNMHPGFFPVQSLQALAARPPGRVLNRYRFGGAVSAIAGPEYKVFIDGRNDLFPDAVHEQYRKLVLLEPGWQQIFNDYHPDYVLWSRINSGQGLVEELKRDERFELVAEQPTGMLFVRKPPLGEDER